MMNPEDLVSEISQSQRTNVRFQLHEVLRIVRFIKTKVEGGCQELRKGRNRVSFCLMGTEFRLG